VTPVNYPALSVLHVAAAALALVAGAFVLLRAKGTRLHRQAGYAYVGAIVVMNISSFFLFNLTGRVSPFHVMAVISLATVLSGFAAAALRRPWDGWLDVHLQFMVWSYIGLLAAAVSEAAVRLPKAPFWGAVAAASFVVLAAGGFLLARRLPRLRERYAYAARQG